MKQKISPAIIAVAIVVVIGIVALVGFKTLGPQSSGKDPYAGRNGTPGQPPGGSYQQHGPDRPPMPGGH